MAEKSLPGPREVSIEALSHEGRGIARVDGKTVFVFGALPRERVLIQVDKRRRKFDQAGTLEVLEPSPDRIQPRCEAYAVCGGCSLQHLGNDKQVEFKQQSLLDRLDHAGIEFGEVMPPLRGHSWGYRKKARLGVKHVPAKGRVLVGFRERNSAFIADMQRCEVLIPEVGHRLGQISALLGRLDARAQIPQIEVAADDTRIILVFRHLRPLSEHDLGCLTEFGKTHGFGIQLQPGGPASVTDLYPGPQSLSLEPVEGESLRIAFKALDFVQVNSEVNQQMVARALHRLEPQSGDQVLDLFCGLGNFTLPLARACSRVTGVDGDASLIERARRAARDNAIENTEYHVSDLSRPDPAYPWMRSHYDKILLDPPRSGALEIARFLGNFNASRIVYISCQPSSLVRDAAIIRDQGYRMTHVGVMDMFPQTAHVESMAVFAAT